MLPPSAALVMAGGRSTRMGRPKAWLPLRDTTLLGHVVEVAAQVCPRVIVVSSPELELPPLPGAVLRVDDPADRPHLGPLSGALTGLAALVGTGVQLAYIGACDNPFVDATHIRFVLSELAAAPSVRAVVPQTPAAVGRDAIVHPLCGAVRLADAAHAARTLVQAGRRAMRDLFSELDARTIPVTDLPSPSAVRRCNTSEEWAAAAAELAAARTP